jgi:hypothetical protein
MRQNKIAPPQTAPTQEIKLMHPEPNQLSLFSYKNSSTSKKKGRKHDGGRKPKEGSDAHSIRRIAL